jgi:hypothetical protein
MAADQTAGKLKIVAPVGDAMAAFMTPRLPWPRNLRHPTGRMRR